MGKNKNKVIDLKPENISEKQLTELQGIVSGINKLKFDIGTAEASKHGMLHTLFQGNEKLNDLQKELVGEYGTSEINIQTGEIIYTTDDESSNT